MMQISADQKTVFILKSKHMKNGLNFFHVFRIGPYIGVNKVGASDVAMNYFFTFITMIILLEFLAAVMPVLISAFYLFVLLLDSDSDVAKGDKLIGSILVVIASTYFFVDVHYEWLASAVGRLFLGDTGFKHLAATNLILGLLHLVLVFFGRVFLDYVDNQGRTLSKYILLLAAAFVLFYGKSKGIMERLIQPAAQTEVHAGINE